jgi:hypothetical protein
VPDRPAGTRRAATGIQPSLAGSERIRAPFLKIEQSGPASDTLSWCPASYLGIVKGQRARRSAGWGQDALPPGGAPRTATAHDEDAGPESIGSRASDWENVATSAHDTLSHRRGEDEPPARSVLRRVSRGAAAAAKNREVGRSRDRVRSREGKRRSCRRQGSRVDTNKESTAVGVPGWRNAVGRGLPSFTMHNRPPYREAVTGANACFRPQGSRLSRRERA